MSTTVQTWKINGQVYTHSQLMEMKKQGLDPRKDNIEMKFITRNKVTGALPEKEEEASVVKKEEEAPVVKKEEEKIEEKVEEKKVKLPTNFMQLKKMASEKGMAVTKETKKEEIIAFLNK